MKSANQVPIMTNSESVVGSSAQRLRQADRRAERAARDGAGPRAVRLRLPRIRTPLEVQAPDPVRLLPHHGRRVRHGPRLVLARLVLHHRPRGRQRRRHQRVHVGTKDPEIEKAWKRAQKDAEPVSITDQRNKGTLARRLDAHPELKDFYNEHDDFTVTNKDRNKYNEASKAWKTGKRRC
jgi:hypothetical protein